MAIEIFKKTFEGTLIKQQYVIKNLHRYKVEKICNVLRFDF